MIDGGAIGTGMEGYQELTGKCFVTLSMTEGDLHQNSQSYNQPKSKENNGKSTPYLRKFGSRYLGYLPTTAISTMLIRRIDFRWLSLTVKSSPD
jgi:hypothetical protein